MPYDGIVTAAVVSELSGLLIGGRIEKVFQTEKDEVTLLCHSRGERYRLLISASPSNPRLHFTKSKKENPMVAPPFCMVLRKYVQGGRITAVRQAGYDRIVTFEIETHNEMGDVVMKRLIAEIMGKHSNLILVSESGIIHDAIRHVDQDVSSVREVMPARVYQLPPAQDKCGPKEAPQKIAALLEEAVDLTQKEQSIGKMLLAQISGFSPLLCSAICEEAGIDAGTKIAALSEAQRRRLEQSLHTAAEDIQNEAYYPIILNREKKDFHCLRAAAHGDYTKFSTVNLMLDEFYTSRDAEERLRQKKSATVKSTSAALERCRRKILIHEDTLQETVNYDELRIKGELLTANMYRLPEFAAEAAVENYYCDPPEPATIPLDPNISISKNAQRYFKKYHKQKNAYENAAVHMEECRNELLYLENVEAMLNNAENAAEIGEIRAELAEQGYLKSDGRAKKENRKCMPLSPHKFQTQDGYQILVGKNSRQNDQLTLKDAQPNDVWFHLHSAPGSHVILRTAEKGGAITAAAIEAAAAVAAWYSSARSAAKADVDYTRVKYVKKIAGARPGMVHYTNFQSITVRPRPEP